MNDSAPLPSRGEPPLVERARRIGWLLLAIAVVAMAAARFGPEAVRTPALATAAAAGLFGLLAIVNVALVRGLYRQLNEMAVKDESDPG